jgi:hypothetical protein
MLGLETQLVGLAGRTYTHPNKSLKSWDCQRMGKAGSFSLFWVLFLKMERPKRPFAFQVLIRKVEKNDHHSTSLWEAILSCLFEWLTDQRNKIQQPTHKQKRMVTPKRWAPVFVAAGNMALFLQWLSHRHSRWVISPWRLGCISLSP